MLESIITALEAAHGKQWSMYVAATGRYVVCLDQDRQQFSSETLADALQSAAAWRKLPEYPRRPSLPPCRDDYRIEKSGSKWELHHKEYAIIGNMPTKRSVEEYIDRNEQRQKQQIEKWDAEIGPLIAGKIEGVHFRYMY